MNKAILVAIYLAVSIPNAFAQGKETTHNAPQDWHTAKIDLAYDYLRCASLYSLQYAMAKKSGASNQQLAELKKVSDNVIKRAIGITKLAKMSNDTATAALKKFTNQMVEDMHNSTNNAGVLISKYGTECKSILDNPEARLNYWINVENKNGQRARQRAKTR